MPGTTKGNSESTRVRPERLDRALWQVYPRPAPGERASWPLGPKPLTLGREHHGRKFGTEVSADHASICVAIDGQARIRNLSKVNGTYVDGEKLEEAALRDQTIVRLQTPVFVYEQRSNVPALAADVDPTRRSAAARCTDREVHKKAQSEATVLIRGESGAGKESIARRIHALSKRAKGPFIAVDCGVLPPGTVHSELFGHAKGAFTGATEKKPGLFTLANGGTLFLDEIDSLTIELQALLKRALQEKVIRPIGAKIEEPVDVRVIVATNQSLRALVDKGRFLSDLRFRFIESTVHVPPLRERLIDLLPLIDELSDERWPKRSPPTFSAEAVEELFIHDWPGNFRELGGVVRFLGELETPDGTPIERADIRAALTKVSEIEWPDVSPEPGAVDIDAIPTEQLQAAIDHHGSVRAAALAIGVSRQTLSRRLKKLSG
jgi:transcriptional regulator with PAS, ATPase and Fis domain